MKPSVFETVAGLALLLAPAWLQAAPTDEALMGPPDIPVESNLTDSTIDDEVTNPSPVPGGGGEPPPETIATPPDDDGDAEDEDAGVDMEPGDAPAEEGGFFSFLDTPHAAVAGGLNWLAKGMDAFFANEKVFYDATGSYIRLTWDNSWSEGGEVHSVGNLKLKLKLPRTQKKLRLVFASDPIKDRDNVDRTVLEQQQTDSGLFAGVQGELGKEEGWHYKPSLHIKLRTPVDYLVRLRADHRFPLEDWTIYFSESVYWFYSTGAGSDTQLEFDHQLDANSVFRAAFFARWTDETDYFTLSEVVSLTHRLTDRRSLSYQAGIYGQSQPGFHVTDYLLQLRYRQRIHSDYLFMELVPEIRYRKDAGFRAEHSLLLRIEMVFNG